MLQGVEVGGGVEILVGKLLQDFVEVLIGAALGRHAARHGALPAGIRTQACGGDRDLLHGVNAAGAEFVEAGAAALPTLGIVVHSVDRDIHGGVRQPIV